MAELITITNAQGQTMQVPDYDLAHYQSQGWTAPATGTPKNEQKTSEQISQELQAMGIDVAGLDDTQLAWLGMMNDWQKMQAQNDKNIAPPSFSPQDMEKYVAQAAQELGPSYQQAMNMDIADLQNSIGNLTNDANYRAQVQQQQFNQEQENLAKQMNEAGLTFSGIRKQAQDQMKSQEKGIVRSQASQYSQRLRDMAGNYQRTYGTEALQALKIPGLSYAGVNIPSPKAPYQLKPGFGTAEQTQAVNVQNRANQIGLGSLGGQAAEFANIKLQPLANL